MKLYRPLQNRSIYNRYIPGSDCTPTLMGVGDTRFSMEKMAEVVENNVEQGQFLAQKLKGKDIASTAQNIHTFLYNNFQYLADDSDQMLRSLSCSWQERETGIDCKSYSIAASTILSNLGISHAFRRVKQPSWLPTQYTHVYVIVYNNQYSLDENDGYFVIDGTIPTTDEVDYLQADDLQMILRGLGFVDSLINAGSSLIPGGSQVKELAGKIDWKKYTASFKEAFSAPGGIFKNLSCLGGSTFDSGNLAQVIDEIGAWYTFLTINLNKAIEKHLLASKQQPYAPNFNPVGDAYLDLWKLGGAVWTGLHNFRFYGYNGGGNWNSACTKRNLEIAIDYAEKIRINFTDKITLQYLNQYFDIVNTGETTTLIDQYCAGNQVNVNFTLCGNRHNWHTTLRQFNLKPNVKEIPALEFTPPVFNTITNNSDFNINDIIKGFKTIITIAGVGSGNTSSTGNSIDVGNGTVTGANNNLIDPPKTKLFSTSSLLIGGTIIATLIYQLKKK